MIQDSLYKGTTQLTIDPETLIHTKYKIKHLPKSYRDFLQTHGAGYLEKTEINTIEPTRDGLDYVLLHGIYGWQKNDESTILDEKFHPEKTGLPEYFLIFYYEDQRYFAFDYANCQVDKAGRLVEPCEPQIRYIDQETDQWLVLADNFQDLLEQLHPTEMFIGDYDYYRHASKDYIRQQLGALTTSSDAQELFEALTENIDELELINWLAWWIKKDDPTISPIASETLEFQLDFRSGALQNKAIKQVVRNLQKNTTLTTSLNELIEEYLND
ncbi:SMI1-KNR4 cell-wall [Granulicatella balaenopterae]|uniref:SMI1-KNR4 cell-wall n=1 Tax=Granulicatella balaenopterae TaxID=137733 RepID=A0A1H9MYU3_9LACT|nr:SMI1/KNR4 family protein [Granulicatella balaenopterae]SER28842.1 SMI1-KNR4 cell-wall [Granulicatella balaenopterae]